MTESPRNGIAEADLTEWLDRHHVEEIRTHATTLDGPGIGKHLNRAKFLSILPKGHAISDMALNMDISGFPHMTIWHPERLPSLGDVYLKPDLDTLIYDGQPDTDLGHCICDYTRADGEALALCPRSTLKTMVSEVRSLGFEVKCTFELEFFLFEESFDDLRRSGYERRSPITANQMSGIYNLRNAYLVKPFMREVTRRMKWKGMDWEGWNDEMGKGQIELNLPPASPVAMADTVVRTKQIIYETAVDLGLSTTFMASLGGEFSNGMHIHHSLVDLDTGVPAFLDHEGPTTLQEHWLGGLVATLPGAVSYLCPTVNSYRRFRDFTAVPTTCTWGIDNKTTALRVLNETAASARIEHRVGAGDLNPYLALATILAGGIAGLRHQLMPTAPCEKMAWGMPASDQDLPTSITSAARTLKANKLLTEVLGTSRVDYWIKTREAEWLNFHTRPAAKQHGRGPVTSWELQRYFEMV